MAYTCSVCLFLALYSISPNVMSYCHQWGHWATPSSTTGSQIIEEANPSLHPRYSQVLMMDYPQRRNWVISDETFGSNFLLSLKVELCPQWEWKTNHVRHPQQVDFNPYPSHVLGADGVHQLLGYAFCLSGPRSLTFVTSLTWSICLITWQKWHQLWSTLASWGMWHVPMSSSAWKRMRKTTRDTGEYLGVWA